MDRQISVHRADVDVQEVSNVLEMTNLDDLPPISSRTVRVFLSSTFSDMIQERNALMERVYPKLKVHCRETHGLEFQMMDLRWGIRDESQDDHTTIEYCLKEIENCKAHSVGPSFVAFLGQKYGYRPFPPNVKAAEYEHIYNALVQDAQDVSMLDLWYKKDENIVPPMYNLQPISSVVADYTSKDEKKQQAARKIWDRTFIELRSLLRQGAELCLQAGSVDQRVRDKYFVSVTEYEIYHGMLKCKHAERFSLAFYRNILNLEDHLHHRRAHKFVDIEPGTGKVDREARDLMHKLKTSSVPKCLKRRPANLYQLDIHWKDPANADPSEDPDYLERFCSKFLTMLVKLIDKAADHANKMNQDPYVVEVLEHLKMCKSRVEVFRGRETIIQQIQDYITESDCPEPMVLYGVSGSGKTSIIAKAASQMEEWLPKGCKPVKILRFLGTTARSASIRLVLGCMCWQIDISYGRTDAELPVDYPGLVNYFNDAIKIASAERPLIIFLDSLDQLSISHNAHDLSWLPKHLPPHVKIVVTTLRYEYDILDTLMTDITCKNHFTEVEPLGSEMGIQIINDWLEGSKRQLTSGQFSVLQEALSRCSLPLYARLVYDRVCTWKSYDPIENTQLAFTVKGVINKLFDRIEKYHGKTFVSHVLSYLTASKNGLSDTEIEDVLSLDDEVLNDVFTYWLPPIRRIPPLLWPRLQSELHRYIIQRETNGIIVYYWYHRQFSKVIEERYLKEQGHVIYIHSMLAHYYLGTWGGGTKKAFKYRTPQAESLGLRKTESEADRMVPLQPIEFNKNPNQPKRLRYNIRKLSELPYHLVKCRQITDLKKDVLFNYTWLLHKLKAMSLHDVLSDFRFALDSHFKDDEEIQIVANSLRISGGNIRQRPESLAFELSGRLLPYYAQYPYIRNLLQQCETIALNDSAIVPLYQCFEAPRGMLSYILEDHKQNVLDLLFSRSTKDLVSLSKDCTIAFWDLRTGERMRVIDLSEYPPEPSSRLHQSKDGKYLCYDSFANNSPVLIYEMRTGQLLYKVGKRTQMQRRFWAEGNLLVRQKNIIDITKGKIVKTLDDFISTKTYLTCGIPNNEEYILLGEEHKTSMFDFQSGELITTFPADNLPSMFLITPDSKRCYVGYSIDCKLKMFNLDRDSKTFGQVPLEYDYLKAYPDLKSMELNMYSNELSSISYSPHDENLIVINIKRQQLIILDVKNCKSKRVDMSKIQLSDRTYISHARFSHDGKFLLATENHFMHVWEANIGKECVFIATVNIHSIDKFPIAVNHEKNLVATASTLHTAIKVWNLDEIYTCSGQQMKVYENPMEVISCASTTRLAFVKTYHGLASKAGYKFIDYFGIDVWNMSTGKNINCLPINRYGQLQQMEVSPDGQQMALLICNRDEAYITLINFRLNKIAHTFSHAGGEKMVVSPGWDFIASEAVINGTHDIKLWSCKTGVLDHFMWATNPVFTLDNAHLLYSLNHNCVEVYALKTMSAVNSIICDSDIIHAIPTLPEQVIVTKFPSKKAMSGRLQPTGALEAQVSVWHITAGFMISQFTHVAPGGMADISKDGRICIDGYLQIFELKTGKLLIDLSDKEEGKEDSVRCEFQDICLTYDGQYAIWLDDLFVKVARVHDGEIIGCICTHEQPICLRTLDFGYIMIIGRDDGHVLTTKLVDGNNKLPQGFHPTDLKERTEWLVDKLLYPDGIIATFDPYYQMKPHKISDALLPRFTKEMQGVLQDKAKVPHAVIKTASFDNLRELEKDKKRRGSSPICDLIHGRRSKETSPIGSPATLPRRKHKYSKSPSASETLSGGTTRGGRGMRNRSPSLHDLFTTQKALQNTGSILMALTDMSPVGKLFKRKSSESASGMASPPAGSPFPARRFSTEPTVDMSNVNLQNHTLMVAGANAAVRRRSPVPPEEGVGANGRPPNAVDYRRDVGRSRFYSTSSDYPQISHL